MPASRSCKLRCATWLKNHRMLTKAVPAMLPPPAALTGVSKDHQPTRNRRPSVAGTPGTPVPGSIRAIVRHHAMPSAGKKPTAEASAMLSAATRAEHSAGDSLAGISPDSLLLSRVVVCRDLRWPCSSSIGAVPHESLAFPPPSVRMCGDDLSGILAPFRREGLRKLVFHFRGSQIKIAKSFKQPPDFMLGAVAPSRYSLYLLRLLLKWSNSGFSFCQRCRNTVPRNIIAAKIAAGRVQPATRPKRRRRET